MLLYRPQTSTENFPCLYSFLCSYSEHHCLVMIFVSAVPFFHIMQHEWDKSSVPQTFLWCFRTSDVTFRTRRYRIVCIMMWLQTYFCIDWDYVTLCCFHDHLNDLMLCLPRRCTSAPQAEDGGDGHVLPRPNIQPHGLWQPGLFAGKRYGATLRDL